METIKKTKSLSEVLISSLSFDPFREDVIIETIINKGIIVNTVDSTKNLG